METTINNQASLQVSESGTVDLSRAPKWLQEKRHRSCCKQAYCYAIAMLLGATEFSDEGHTGDNIRRQTELDLEAVGLTLEDIHAKVSNQGNNIKKAWGGLPGGYCTAHTLNLAVKEYLGADDVANGVKKTKVMTTYFHRSSNRLSRLSDLQKELQVAVNQPPQTSNTVCWHYTHDSMN